MKKRKFAGVFESAPASATLTLTASRQKSEMKKAL
jgi:hypothetical protein